MKKVIVTDYEELLISCSLPKYWKKNFEIITPLKFNQLSNISGIDIYSWDDHGYDVVSHKLNDPNQGFCKKLSEICNNKYTHTREQNIV